MSVEIESQMPGFIPLRNSLPEQHLPRESPNKFTKFQKMFHKKKINLYRPPPPPLSGTKTLVLDLDETLIHSSQFPPHPSVKFFILHDDSIQIDVNGFDPQTNWESKPDQNSPLFIYMRPGLEEFISYAKENFEVFVYTYAERGYAEPILDVIFPDLDEDHRLYRDSCITATRSTVSSYLSSASKASKKATLSGDKKYKLNKSKIKDQNGVIKDLVMLGRNMNELVFVDDNDYQALKVNNNNTIVIPMWKGIPNDNALQGWLMPILDNCIAAKDVRDIICNISNKVRRFTL